MATQATTVAAFQLLCAEVADAIAAADWPTAYSKYAQAEAVNMALELSATDTGASLRRRESMAGLKTALAAAREVVSQDADSGRLITTQTRVPY